MYDFFQTLSQIIEYLWLAHTTNLAELKKKRMEWLSARWDTVKGDGAVKQLMNDEEGRQIVWEFVDYLNKKG